MWDYTLINQSVDYTLDTSISSSSEICIPCNFICSIFTILFSFIFYSLFLSLSYYFCLFNIIIRLRSVSAVYNNYVPVFFINRDFRLIASLSFLGRSSFWESGWVESDFSSSCLRALFSRTWNSSSKSTSRIKSYKSTFRIIFLSFSFKLDLPISRPIFKLTPF